MSDSIVINTEQMDQPIFIMVPMPTIILQMPAVRRTQSWEVGNGSHNGPNTRCTHCGYRQSEEIQVDDIKKEIKEEMIFQHDIDERNYSNEYVRDNGANLDEAHLSAISEADIKEEPYDWEHLFVDKSGGKYIDMSGIISYLKQEITD